MKPFLKNDWQDILAEEFEKTYYQNLRGFLKQAYARERVFPPMKDIYNALHETSYADTKVVILGQDPYHGEGQAHGLAFSVLPQVDKPPSLVNIFKELHSDLGCDIPKTGCLLGWSRQGVLLLNTTLTVRSGSPKSHAGQGWEQLTDAIMMALAKREEPLIFILWGAHAQSKKRYINDKKHGILMAPHPSPLSAHRGFFGSKPFSKSNTFLVQHGMTPIQWCQSEG